MAKAFASLPGPRGWPLVGNLCHALRNGALSKQLHKYFMKQHKKYGPIYYENLGSYAAVGLNDPHDAETLFRNEGKYPRRTRFEAFSLYRQLAGQSKGVLLYEGEDWQRNRSALNIHMMRPRSVAEHTQDFGAVADDLINKLAKIQKSEGHVPELHTLLFKWSLESFCTLLFEQRLGCLDDQSQPHITEFIDAIQGLLNLTETLLIFPPQLAKALRLPIWTKFCQHLDTLFDIGNMYLEKHVAKIKPQLESGKSPSGLIASLIATQQLSDKEILANVIDVMSAAIDTTSNTVIWALYLLARNQPQQERMYQHICSVLPSVDDVITQKHVNQLNYVKAVVKETLRLYPVAALVSRLLNDDMVIRDYDIPAGTLVNVNVYAMRDNPEFFPEPERFMPERWLRSEVAELPSAFASPSFGIGPRSCIGRRVAELEIDILLSKIIQRFAVHQVEDKEVQDEMRFMVTPTEPIRLRFVDRKTL